MRTASPSPKTMGLGSPSHFAGEWRRALRLRLLGGDLITGLLAVTAAHLGRFGTDIAQLKFAGLVIDYRIMAVLMVLAWVGLLMLLESYDLGKVDLHKEQRLAVRRAGLYFLSAVAVLVYLLKVSPPRGYVLVAIPLMVLGSSLIRALAHRHTVGRRKLGKDMERTALLGEPSAMARLLDHIERNPEEGFEVVGVLPTSDSEMWSDPLPPILGSPSEAAAIAVAKGIDYLIVTNTAGTVDIQRLAWGLQESGCSLAVAPEAISIAGPKLLVRRQTDLPLLRLEDPRLSRSGLVWKSVTDRILASAALVLLSPVFLAIAAAIRIESRGPVFFRHQRFGLQGSRFEMVKFRTMVDGAANAQDQVMDSGQRNGAIFKHENDPRITRVGRVLRRLSLDELPQLVNVFKGEMSMVGPRPRPVMDLELHLAEAGALDHREERRMFVKPGLTGLWQVSGRSNLPIDEALRLDMYYIDHWSPRLDAVIMWRTFAAVIMGRGAY